MDNFTFNNKLLKVIVLIILALHISGCKFSLSWKGSEETSDSFVIVEKPEDSVQNQAGTTGPLTVKTIDTTNSGHTSDTSEKSFKDTVSLPDSPVVETAPRRDFIEISGDRMNIFLVTPGKISLLVHKENPDSVKSLKISGSINADDLRYVSLTLKRLEYLDLGGCKIQGNGIPDNLFNSEQRSVRLRQIILPEGIEYIGQRAFASCLFLEKVPEFPEGFRTIDNAAFANCRNMKGPLLLPSSLEKIGNWAFSNCSGLGGELRLPESLKYLGDHAFLSCSSLSGFLIIPPLLTFVKFGTFCNCEGLQGIIFHDGLKEIEKHAFSYCTSFREEIAFPQSLEKIGLFAFAGCNSLPGNLSIPIKVKTIGMKAFFMCESLSSVSVRWTTPIEYTSEMLPLGAKIFVPANSIDLYKNTPGWNNHRLQTGK